MRFRAFLVALTCGALFTTLFAGCWGSSQKKVDPDALKKEAEELKKQRAKEPWPSQ